MTDEPTGKITIITESGGFTMIDPEGVALKFTDRELWGKLAAFIMECVMDVSLHPERYKTEDENV